MRLTNADVLKLLKQRVYTVDLAQGVVLGQRGKPLKTVEREGGFSGVGLVYLFVELYHKDSDKRRKIGVSSLVWMAGTQQAVPRGFEIHHQDMNTLNNAFINLYCLHTVDH